ncbi:P-loop containing nucleoside triphosphate hydrolase protein [Irpex rosettiformis]|uniref:P-loop containing nucleoside triphosphate hydrolase protein n=1 Tax=Irpex rosettiformis TaxID=378272 RepID=A0ACB8TUT2_9APHY|nr:P-loop containing nucleoside triphosphate hydrolase protein [Irpex rosettiformis]
MNRPVRQGYNAKARQSTAGSRKKGKRKTSNPDTTTQNTNAEIVQRKSDEQKELDRKERLREELLAQSESKVNSKKKKRLEKYIEKKLKQEERVVLFEKLSKSQAELPNALNLHSSATLGTGKSVTHQERLEREEHHATQQLAEAANTRVGRKRKRSKLTYSGAASDDSISEDFDVGAVEQHHKPEPNSGLTRETAVVVIDNGFSTTTQDSRPRTDPVSIGGALRKNPDGSIAPPHIVKKRGGKNAFALWKEPASKQMTTEDSDTSFDSSDSAYDTDSDSEEQMDSEVEEKEIAEQEGSSDEKSEGNTGTAEEVIIEPKRKKLSFKDWAVQQLSVAKTYVAPIPSDTTVESPQETSISEPPIKKRKVENSHPAEMRGPLGRDLVLPDTALAKHVVDVGKADSTMKRKVISIARPIDVEEVRLLLPIVSEEQPIMEAILLNPVVVICGETGSGKTTQVPQFLYEAGFGSPGSDNPGIIGITQPRRVAAMSMASRVAHELSLTPSKVSYQIRYDATVSPDTSIKFMTDGVLLRELATDFLLMKYSVIIIDEAHERSMNTDILIGVLSRVIKLREEMWAEQREGVKPLRLIIMSATLRVSDFAENTILFPKSPPIINVSARQHPVTIHFSRRTSSDYVNEAIRKASKIHARLPPGGILIFLTGQNEISGVCKKLEARYGAKALEERKRRRGTGSSLATSSRIKLEPEARQVGMRVVPAQADIEAEDMELGEERTDLAFDVDNGNMDDVSDEEALDSDDELNEELGLDTEESDVPMHVIPLYALLPSEKQMQVFNPPPEGHRLVVVSTNVAETSLTIPNIRYVVDCGRAKERHYSVGSGIQSFQVSWISKASAAQRAGRAGRTGPGHCYRLYSSALYENYFAQFSQPEILRMPIDGVVLQMKSMHVDAVVNFPFPTAPDRPNLLKAEKILTYLGALTGSNGDCGGQITDIGRAMSLFPLSPRYSRMLVSGRQHGCLPYVITIVSILSVGDPFLREEALEADESEDEDMDDAVAHLKNEAIRAKEARRLRRKQYFESQQRHGALGDYASDIFKMLSVVGAYEYAGGGHEFCSTQFVRPKAMEEIHKLRAQISSIVQTNFPDSDIGFMANLKPPSKLQLKVLRQLIAAGFIDQVAVRKDKVSKDGASGQQYTTSRGVAYTAMGIDEDVYIHPSSALVSSPPPDFIVYVEVVRTTKVWLKGVTVINATWLSSLGKSLCTFSKPIKKIDGSSVVIPHFGPAGWELPAIPSTK